MRQIAGGNGRGTGPTITVGSQFHRMTARNGSSCSLQKRSSPFGTLFGEKIGEEWRLAEACN
jgi:hypothetical protein